MMVKPLEKDVEKAILHAFRLKYHITLYKTDAGAAGMRLGMGKSASGRSGLPTGFPDLLGAIPGSGRMIVIEVKRPGKKPTDIQGYFLTLFREIGVIAFWADSLDTALQKYENALKEDAA